MYARKASSPAKCIENEKAKSLLGLTCRNCSNLSTPGIVASARAADKKSVSAAEPLGWRRLKATVCWMGAVTPRR